MGEDSAHACDAARAVGDHTTLVSVEYREVTEGASGLRAPLTDLSLPCPWVVTIVQSTFYWNIAGIASSAR